MSRRRARGPSRIASSSSSRLLDDWLGAVLATPGLTSIRDPAEARRMLLEDSVRGVEVLEELDGPIVDVGSGGGAPGIPLAAALPDREVTLLEAERRKADFLEGWCERLPNLRVVRGRAEEQETDQYGVAVAKALAQPPVAAEWLLPLVRPGGSAVLWTGPSADLDAVARVASLLGGAEPEDRNGLVVIRKLGPTPEGFPRRPGTARKRPLA
ncbi:MAG TPA: RsmG family class I SAM-dependent methyltransferase [Gaiellaceae bacterium]|nr:RsmG family class I SAM-dependent methyltransferase [Gaiellaceae bacterium]